MAHLSDNVSPAPGTHMDWLLGLLTLLDYENVSTWRVHSFARLRRLHSVYWAALYRKRCLIYRTVPSSVSAFPMRPSEANGNINSRL